MKENAILFKEYQTFFKDLFDERNYNSTLVDIQDGYINYIVDFEVETKKRKHTMHILFYINVADRVATVFCTLNFPFKNRFFNQLSLLNKANTLNSVLPYGKLYFLKNKMSYMAKFNLPDDISCFNPEIIDRCIFEITYIKEKF